MIKILTTACAVALFSLSASAQTTLQYASSATQAGSLPLQLDYFSAERGCSAARPTVLFIHGGAFKGGSRTMAASKGYPQAFNAAGINLAAIDYRKIGDNPLPSAPYARMTAPAIPQERIPGQMNAAAAAFEDTNKALSYLVANASSLCIDTREIFLMGSSAGAIAAMNVAYSFDEAGIRRPSIEGVIDLWGGSLPETAIDAGNVPIFIAHGERDPTVDFAWAESIWARANAIGVPAQFHAFRSKGHGFNLNRTRVNGTPVMDLVVEFVEDIVAGRRIETLRTRSR